MIAAHLDATMKTVPAGSGHNRLSPLLEAPVAHRPDGLEALEQAAMGSAAVSSASTEP